MVLDWRPDPADRFRQRQERLRRRRRRRRLLAIGVLLLLVVSLSLNARLLTHGRERDDRSAPVVPAPAAGPVTLDQAPELMVRPAEVRGVHVPAAAASSGGELERVLALRSHGLNTVVVTLRDEHGRRLPPAAAQRIADRVHAAGVWLIGRICVFADSRLAERRPELAVRTRDGAVWADSSGLRWTSPYQRAVWQRAVDVGAAAARLGFDEIMLDFVLFPPEARPDETVFPGRIDESRAQTLAGFVDYAHDRLRRLAVRVSVTLLGLAASKNLEVGQAPRLLARHVDSLSPTLYPSSFAPGEYELAEPAAAPGLTVARALIELRRKLQGIDVPIVPWLQGFSDPEIVYREDEIRAQIDAARAAGADGYLLWNPSGRYLPATLAPR